MSNNKLVYIASPYAGDVEQKVRFAKAACRYAIEPVSDTHLPAWGGPRSGVRSNREIKSSLGLGVVRFNEAPPEPPEVSTYAVSYTHLDVYKRQV